MSNNTVLLSRALFWCQQGALQSFNGRAPYNDRTTTRLFHKFFSRPPQRIFLPAEKNRSMFFASTCYLKPAALPKQARVTEATTATTMSALTRFSPMSHFYTPWKRQKIYGFLTFSGSIKLQKKLSRLGIKLLKLHLQ